MNPESTGDAGPMQLAALGSAAVRQALALTSRALVEQPLAPAFALALQSAASRAPFKRSVNSGDRSLDLDLAELDSLSAAQRERMQALIHAGARSGFQYCFDTYRLSDEVEAGALQAGPLFELYQALNSAPVLALLRELAGEPGISYCDAQVTRYRPGDFLTQHDDGIEGKQRVLAYVINLSQDWRMDWGGLLMFGETGSQPLSAYLPGFNRMQLFKVPQPHAVSMVAPFAGADRLSITGWARR